MIYDYLQVLGCNQNISEPKCYYSNQIRTKKNLVGHRSVNLKTRKPKNLIRTPNEYRNAQIKLCILDLVLLSLFCPVGPVVFSFLGLYARFVWQKKKISFSNAFLSRRDTSFQTLTKTRPFGAVSSVPSFAKHFPCFDLFS